MLGIVTKDGYRATVRVGWHRRQIVARDSLFPGCLDAESTGGSAAGVGQVRYYAVTAQLNARFPTTSGFSWPAEQAISVDFDDGRTTQYWDRAYTCYDSQDVTSVAEGRLPLSPVLPTATVMWVEIAKRTPDNPSGSLKTDPGTYEISVDALLGTCQEEGANGDPAAACVARYGQ